MRSLLSPIRRAWARHAPLGPSPEEAFLQALDTHRMAQWAARWPDFVPPASYEDPDWVASSAPRLTAATWAPLRAHPVRHAFAHLPLLTWAVERGDHAMLPLLTGSQWADAAAFNDALVSTIAAAPSDPDLCNDAALVLATMADRHIAQARWSSYGQAIAGALMRGHIGVIPWAAQENLPIFGCLPVREQMFTVYNTGTNDACFRLATFLGRATTAHQGVQFRRMLALAGSHPSRALFHPSPAFIKACQELPLP